MLAKWQRSTFSAAAESDSTPINDDVDIAESKTTTDGVNLQIPISD